MAPLASVLGGTLGYLLGMLAWDAGLDRLFFDYVPGFTEERFDSVLPSKELTLVERHSQNVRFVTPAFTSSDNADTSASRTCVASDPEYDASVHDPHPPPGPASTGRGSVA